MSFTIPNEADAFHADQAEPDKVDIDVLVAGLNGSGVLSGCAVTAQGSPDMTVAVAAGVVTVMGTTATVSAGNVTITAADATNPRIDLIVSSNAGTKSATAGTAAASPVMPSIPANSVVLAAVYVPANDTTIASNQITDKRVIVATKYVIGFSSTAAMSPADSSTYYFGSQGGTATQGVAKVFIPRSGTIKACFLHFLNAGTLGSAETSTVSIRLNNSTDTTITSSFTSNAVSNDFNNTALSIAVVMGDYIEIKWVTPAWATNPTNIYGSGMIYIE